MTQVAWRGEGSAPRQTTEYVREGITATVAGRSIDQGILAQLVIEDTDVHSVHTMNVPAPGTASVSNARADHTECPAASLVNHVFADVSVICFDEPLAAAKVFDQPVCVNNVVIRQIVGNEDSKSPDCCESTCPASAHHNVVDAATNQAGACTAGTPGCCADDDANAAECHGTHAAAGSVEKAKWSPARSAQMQIPEIGHAEIAGEWLIPRDEYLVVAFGPHTVADKDGKAVVRERLALVSAEETVLPAASTGPDTPELTRSLPRVAVTPPPRLAIPALPSRSLPQGVHADGTPAELPPLPDDEKDVSPSDDSSEPRPSPQMKKPCPSPGPAAKPAAKPAATIDNTAAKAAFQLAKGLFKPNTLPSIAFPNLQFMMPLKPFAMKLPFNQKLELELIGRVVPDAEAAADAPQADE